MTGLTRSALRWLGVVANLATLIFVVSLESWQWALGLGLVALAWAAIIFAIREPSDE